MEASRREKFRPDHQRFFRALHDPSPRALRNLKPNRFWVLLCSDDPLSLFCPDAITSTTFIATRSQPRNLLSMAILNRARSRWFSANSSRTRIAQTCLGFSGSFWPTMRPLFQAGRSARMAGKFGVCMIDPPIRHTLPLRQPDFDGAVYHKMCKCS